MATLFTLPQHLRDAIEALTDANIAPEPLQKDMLDALADADLVQFEDPFDEDAVATGGEKKQKPKKEQAGGDQDEEDLDTATSTEQKDKSGRPGSSAEQVTQLDVVLPPVPKLRPATIDGDLLERTSRWAGGEAASEAIIAASLGKYRCYPAAYGPIAILVGTEVYLPPRQRALARSAERESLKKEERNPYLPANMSITPPSLGSEYRQMMKQLANVFNVLFSIFGCGGGAYVAAVTGGGWEKEPAIILAIIVGAVVGLADIGLIVLYRRRLGIERKAAAIRRVRENKGSAAIGEGTVLEIDEAKLAELEKEWAEAEAEGGAPVTDIPTQTRTIRLRRRAL